MLRNLTTLFFVLGSVVGLAGQSVFATKVLAFDTKGNAGTGIFDPMLALGAPTGQGGMSQSRDVHSLGVGGFLTLGFDVTLRDGPGADFLVFENSFFIAGGEVFAEGVFIEVSSNGTDFARFPTAYVGPSSSAGIYDVHPVTDFRGLAGVMPVYAGLPGVDSLDVVEAGGDAFDLADLATHPLVIANKVDLNQITQIRCVDVESGFSRDSAGTLIFDPTQSSGDIDAIAVIHHTGNVAPRGPELVLSAPNGGGLLLRVEDPDGLADIASLRMAVNGVPMPPIALLAVMTVQSSTPNAIALTLGPLPATFRFRLSVSVKDQAGNRSGATRTRQ